MNNKEYQEYVESICPKQTCFKNYVFAFVIGGVICIIGQIIYNICFYFFGLNKELSSMLTTVILIFLGSFLTGIGVYDSIGKVAGAGSVVPITGFANSIVSPAMEYKQEGYVLGVSANLFKVAGPVLVYGIGSSVVCGFVYYMYLLIK